MKSLWRTFLAWWVLDEPKEASVSAWVVLWGGPRDGARILRATAPDRLPTYAAYPLCVSPWGREDTDPTDTVRLVIDGWYVRDGDRMTWRAV